MSDWLDREEALIEQALDRGEITEEEAVRQLKAVRAEWLAEKRERAQAAWDREMDQ
jgi:hypothetical protein